jgi:hypothetical protein
MSVAGDYTARVLMFTHDAISGRDLSEAMALAARLEAFG